MAYVHSSCIAVGHLPFPRGSEMLKAGAICLRTVVIWVFSHKANTHSAWNRARYFRESVRQGDKPSTGCEGSLALGKEVFHDQDPPLSGWAEVERLHVWDCLSQQVKREWSTDSHSNMNEYEKLSDVSREASIYRKLQKWQNYRAVVAKDQGLGKEINCKGAWGNILGWWKIFIYLQWFYKTTWFSKLNEYILPLEIQNMIVLPSWSSCSYVCI